ncbi:YbxH family protein [Bacillus sp. CGMCC 1.16607]|uniref:YbxH family protein n=1 Tax=Bacillus sp. CGMCC 1.16607 TaxID=3351842 RepID=UPI003644BA0C
MGAVERNGYVFEPEYSVINQKGAIHVYNNGSFVEEIQFNFTGEFPELDFIEGLIDSYCQNHNI